MREYRRVPALESGSKLSNPDLQDIGEKNYTDIILRYGNLTTKFPQLDTNAKTIVAAINELYAHPGGSIVIPNPPIDNGLQTESGDILETESGEPIEPEQGGHVVGPLYSIGIDGDIYTVEGSGTAIKTIEMILAVNNWDVSTLEQSLSIYDLTSTSTVLVAPIPDDNTYDTFIQCSIRAVSQTTGSLTFRCKNIPDVDVGVTISYWENY